MAPGRTKKKSEHNWARDLKKDLLRIRNVYRCDALVTCVSSVSPVGSADDDSSALLRCEISIHQIYLKKWKRMGWNRFTSRSRHSPISFYAVLPVPRIALTAVYVNRTNGSRIRWKDSSNLLKLSSHAFERSIFLIIPFPSINSFRVLPLWFIAMAAKAVVEPCL